MATRPKTGGRTKGTPNKENKALREMILQALNEQPGGGVEYLKIQAVEKPVAFMSLLGRVLPLQVANEEGQAFEVVHKVVREIVRPAHKDG